MAEVRIFLSSVSAEFRIYRDVLRHYLDRPNVTVKVQEDFIATGTATLDMLDDYIAKCDVVIHLVGDMTGAMAQTPSIAVIGKRYPDFGCRLPLAAFLQTGGPPLSYTQWEAWLALYHGKRLLIAVPESGAKRDERYLLDPTQQAAQQAHLTRLESIERYPGIHFVSADQFAADIWRSSLLDILIEAGLVRKVAHLRYTSLGDLFKGRESLLDDVSACLRPVLVRNDRPAAVKALTGMGGVGKTRLAVEYAWRHASDYTAMLFVEADSAEALNRNLAALCGATILNLPEREETDEGQQRDAVIRWLQANPGWLLILDNVDSRPAAAAVRTLLPQLMGGHVLITSRLKNWSASIPSLPVELLSPEASVDFLLTRTQTGRRTQADDLGQASDLALELGFLALALEQAGAYIVTLTLSLGQYRERWQRQRESVLAWYDSEQMDYPRSVAITWQTSFDQLGASARRLLQRLAWLAPEPIPEWLLDVPVPGADATGVDHPIALAELNSFSLVTRSHSADAPDFRVHRLVQEVTRRDLLHEDSAHSVLVEALNWVNDAFVGDPSDVRKWQILDSLAPHARAVATYADQAGIVVPTARLLTEVGRLLSEKALYAEAEPLIRRALAINEAHFGAEDPMVAISIDHLAWLLKTTNRQTEASRLMRRALAIDKAIFGVDHPKVAMRLTNLALLLKDTGRLARAETLMRRARAIDEASLPANDPQVATDLNTLALLLKDTDCPEEAEKRMYRALQIDESHFADDPPKVATDLNTLALLLKDTQRPAEAEPLMRRALKIDEAHFGANHPKVAIDLNSLALLIKDIQRLANAKVDGCYDRKRASSCPGCHHYSTCSLCKDAYGQAALIRLPEAEALMRRALAIEETRFGAKHPYVVAAINNLAFLLKDTQLLVEAELLMRRALAIDEAHFGANHPKVATDLNSLAWLLKDLKRPVEAEDFVRRALAIDIESRGLDHPSLRDVGSNFIELLQLLGRTNDEIKAELASLASMMSRA